MTVVAMGRKKNSFTDTLASQQAMHAAAGNPCTVNATFELEESQWSPT